MTEITLNIALLLLLIVSLAIVATGTLRRAIIFSGIMSIIAAFTYMLLSAPDVALAEAVIGSTLSTVILLVGIKKSKLFTVYYLESTGDTKDRILRTIESSLHDKDLDPQFICTNRSKMDIRNHYDFEVLIREVGDKVEIYGESSNSLFKKVFEDIVYEIGEENILLMDIYSMKED